MNNFINHLLLRHLEPGTSIKPRTRSRFEPATDFPGFYPGTALVGQNTAEQNPRTFSLQDYESIHSVNDDDPNSSPIQSLVSIPGIFREKGIINNDFLEPSFSRPPFKTDNPPWQGKEEETFNADRLSPIHSKGQ